MQQIIPNADLPKDAFEYFSKLGCLLNSVLSFTKKECMKLNLKLTLDRL